MGDILVRDVDSDALERLRKRAAEHGRSLQKEAKLVLEEAARFDTMDEARARAARIRASLSGRKFPDSADLIREDRDHGH